MTISNADFSIFVNQDTIVKDRFGRIIDVVDDLYSLKLMLREQYQAIRTAIIELVKGERVATVTISGKTTQFSQIDLPQLRTIRDELTEELRGLFGGQNRCFKVQSSKGF